MEIYAFLLGIAATVIATVVGDMVLSRPKIITPYDKGWRVDEKRIENYIGDKLATRDYYNIYGITIQNSRRNIIGRAKAEITSVSIKIWDSQNQLIDSYQGRLWKHRHAGQEHLFSPKNEDEKGKRSIGEGEELDIVIAYNQENETDFYKFTIESDKHKLFPSPVDKLPSVAPYFAFVEIHLHRSSKPIYLRLDSLRDNKVLDINIVSKDDFPIPEKEMR